MSQISGGEQLSARARARDPAPDKPRRQCGLDREANFAGVLRSAAAGSRFRSGRAGGRQQRCAGAQALGPDAVRCVPSQHHQLPEAPPPPKPPPPPLKPPPPRTRRRQIRHRSRQSLRPSRQNRRPSVQPPPRSPSTSASSNANTPTPSAGASAGVRPGTPAGRSTGAQAAPAARPNIARSRIESDDEIRKSATAAHCKSQLPLLLPAAVGGGSGSPSISRMICIDPGADGGKVLALLQQRDHRVLDDAIGGASVSTPSRP